MTLQTPGNFSVATGGDVTAAASITATAAEAAQPDRRDGERDGRVGTMTASGGDIIVQSSSVGAALGLTGSASGAVTVTSSTIGSTGGTVVTANGGDLTISHASSVSGASGDHRDRVGGSLGDRLDVRRVFWVGGAVGQRR